MKKKASGKIRLKLPKKKRFGRFFLRRLLICMLAAMCIGAAAMQSRYRKNAEEFDDRCQESWTRKLESLTSDEGEKEKGKTKAERIIEARDAQYLVNALATGSVGLFGFTPDPFIDCAAVLIHSQKLEYFISEPMVGTYLYTYGNTRHPKLKEQIYLEPEMSEQILGDLLEVSRASNSRQWASLLLDYFGLYRFMDQCAPLREYLRNTYYDDIMLRISADAENRVRKAVVGLMNADGEIFRVFSYGTEEAGECTEYTSDDYVLKDGAYQETDASKPPEGDYLSGMFCIGYPSASKCGRFVRDLVEDEGTKYQEYYSGLIAEMQEIISDDTGEKRAAYYKEQLRAISDEFRNLDDPMKNEWYSERVEQIRTPEEMLAQYYNSFGMGLKQYLDYFTQKAFCSAGFDKIEIHGETWYLLHCDHTDYRQMLMPFFIGFSIVLLLCAVILALLWAFAAYRRFLRKYEMEEYRRNLTASLAHDLKSPLMAISSYSENLLNDVQPEKKHHYSKAILENTQYMDNIIVNVLELSRLETHEKTKRKFIDLAALAKELLDGMQEQLDVRGLTATVFGSCCVKANCEMMKQAIRNLLDNAVKFTPDGGSITVTGKRNTLSIVNTIEEEQISDPQALCEAFAKGDDARSNRSGTGLGLSIVRQITIQNRMELLIDSRAHQFRVRLRQNVLQTPAFRSRKKQRS